jgi:hypothetical protein
MLNFVVLHKHHAFASSLILAMKTFVGEAWCWDTLALRFFHISQEISMILEDMAILAFPRSTAWFVHQSLMDAWFAQSVGRMLWLPYQPRIYLRILAVKGHL